MRVKVEAAAAAGDGGGGIATALGTRCFGVSRGVRLLVGVVDGRPTPMPEPRPPVPGFGVFREYGPRFEPVKGETGLLNRVGLPVAGVRLPDCPVGLVGSRPRLPVRFIPNRMSYRNVVRHSRGIPFMDVVVVLVRGRAEGVTASINTRDEEAGVTRPLEYGVYRVEFDGVMRPEE